MKLINNGWLNIYKPINITSSNTVIKIKKKFKLKKVGHAGTLDKNAQGVLPIAFGNATKTISFVMNKNKKYLFKIKWGIQTSTDDAEGEIIYRSKKIPNKKEIENVIKKYKGEIKQIPPKYSAIKINGIRAYKLSRSNKIFSLKARKVKVYSFKYIRMVASDESLFEIECSPGFYVRSLARDIAISLKTRGFVTFLERLQVGIFNKKSTILLDDLVKISHLSDRIKGFCRSSVVLGDIPALTVNNHEAINIRMGKKIDVSIKDDKLLKSLHSKEIISVNNNKELIAIGYIQNSFFKPRKVFN